MSDGNVKRKSSAKTLEDTANVSNQKAPKKRTKSGCLTCRRRRIKCDEAKPECKNCVKAKKACEQAPAAQNLTRRQSSKSEAEIHRESSGSSNSVSVLSRARTDSSEFTATGSLPIHYPQSYASSISHGSRQSPKETRDNYSPLQPAAIPLDGTHFSEFFMSPQLKFSEVSRSFNNDVNMPGPSTPALAFEQLGLASPMSQHQDGNQFPFFHSSAADASLTSTQALSSQRQIHGLSNTGPPASMPFLRARLPSDPAILSRQDFATKTGLDFRISKRNYGEVLSSRQRYYLRYFMLNVHMNFTTTTETRPTPSEKMIITTSNLFSKIIPSMALQSYALLHALLAISALHEANVKSTPEHEALMDYQDSIQYLAQALAEPGAFDCDNLLATCLILAYFETMSGHVAKWGRHLQGSCDLVRSRILAQYTTNQPGHYQFVGEPSIADHLIWFHIHQDTIQAILSGNGLFLDLQYIQMCPIRGDPGSVMHVSDQLRVLLGRIGDFVSKDRVRKEARALDSQALSAAVEKYDELLAAMDDWRSNLNPAFSSSVLPDAVTPFGSILVFAHPAIASFQILSLAAMLYLRRSHPTYSAIPAESMRSAASTTFVIVQDIVKILSGIMAESMSNKSIEHGAHLKAMINATLPALLAGIAVREAPKRAFLERLVQDIYLYTGWRTAIRVLQGFDVAWGREPRSVEGLELLTAQDPPLQHDRGQDTSAAPYAALDKAETMSVASGILGKLKVKDTVPRNLQQQQQQQRDQSWLDSNSQVFDGHASQMGGGGTYGDGSEPALRYMDGHAPFVDWNVPIEAFADRY